MSSGIKAPNELIKKRVEKHLLCITGMPGFVSMLTGMNYIKVHPEPNMADFTVKT